MTRWRAGLVTLLAALLLAPGVMAGAQEQEPVTFQFGDFRFAEVYPSTVKLRACDELRPSGGAISLAEFQNRSRCRTGWSGSGTVIRADGLILTNAHVALDERQEEPVWLLVMRTIDDRTPPEPAYFGRAVLHSQARKLDLAVVAPAYTLDGQPIQPGEVTMRPLPMTAPGAVESGDALANIGYPGIGGELISNFQGSVSGFEADPAVPEIGSVGWIKTDATMGGGISGGTTINDRGELIGVPTRLGEIEDRGSGIIAQTNLARLLPEGYDTLLEIGTGEGIPPLAGTDAPPTDAPADVTVTGSVVSADSGQPVPGAWFIVLDPGVPVADYLAGRQDAVYSFATSGADGAFQLKKPVARGQAYGVVVIARGYRNTSEDNRVLAAADAPAVVTLPPIHLAVQR